MPFDTQTRNALNRVVTRVRGILDEEFTEQLQELYGIQPSGEIVEVESLDHLGDEDRDIATVLRERISHISGLDLAGRDEFPKSAQAKLRDAISRVIREQAFTVLNRLAALRMAEERDLVQECVREGMASEGFVELFGDLAGSALGETYDQYRVYLQCLFDELAVDLGILFDRFDSSGLLFPRRSALDDVLAELQGKNLGSGNDALSPTQFARIWAEDEAIGWVYQYWNSKEERKAMRDASAAPRNSRELAVRNQFFTPRYVVEFLTDNTLGRIWYEMTRGRTGLAEQCRYLVRRPTEIFLQPLEDFIPEGCRDWVREVRSGNFAAAEMDATWDEMASVALAIDGYEVAEQLRIREVHDHVRPRWEQAEKEGRVDDDTLLEQWLLLFSAQRGVLREHFQERDTSLQAPVRAVWEGWVRAAQAEAAGETTEGLGQEELLRRPVFIPPREPKDPREIRLLDPACGSMHFGLYAFDLFETIYREAWDAGLVPKEDFGARYRAVLHHDTVRPSGRETATSNYSGREVRLDEAEILIAAEHDSGDGVEAGVPHLVAPGTTFRVPDALRVPFAEFDYRAELAKGTFTPEQGESFLRSTGAYDYDEDPVVSEEEARERFHQEIPRLIIEHNIHGVDIDPRAVQIAGLSLWLRAQRSWKEIPAAERPRVRRSNIVCAEPMPGSEAMLEDFVQTLDPPLLGELVKTVFDKMQLAGEAGTLLKIEEEIRTAIDDAKAKWEKLGAAERDLFSAEELNQTLRPGTQQELTGVEKALTTDHRPLATDFFDTAEERIYAALRDYAESAEAGDYQRRLFAEDAAHGFAFIDLCRKRYDAFVMNPPFGPIAEGTDPVLKRYKSFSDNIAAPFAERGLEMSQFVAMVVDRALLVRKTHEDFRLLFLDASTERLAGSAIYGWGVLDANVEVAGLIASDHPNRFSCSLRGNESIDEIRWVENKGYQALPNTVIAGEIPDFILNSFARNSALGKTDCSAKVGNQWKSERYLRLWWECEKLGSLPTYNGGAFTPYEMPTRNAMSMPCEDRGLLAEKSTVIRNASFHGKPGIGYGKRGIYLDAHVLPAGQTFTVEGLACFPARERDRWKLLAFLNAPSVSVMLSFYCGQHKHVGYLNRLPFSSSWELGDELLDLLRQGSRDKRLLAAMDETCLLFSRFTHASQKAGLQEEAREFCRQFAAVEASSHRITKKADDVVSKWLGFPPDWAEDPEVAPFIADEPKQHLPGFFDESDVNTESWFASRYVGLTVGLCFGQFDIRYATGERQPPELPDPFDPLPVCPPGMLQNADGLPAAPSDVPDDYPLPITWPGILVSDPGHLSHEGFSEDIVARVRDALAVIWGDRSAAIEQEACEILGVRTLRDYFAEKKSGGKFFKDHLKRYSKSRRQAPIYWPLSTESGTYTLWIYYHRLDDQTLFRAIEKFVTPKLEQVEHDIDRLRTVVASDDASAKDRTRLEKLEDLRTELLAFRGKLEHWAPLWKPNLNDGVQITAAPLWKLFRLKPWQKKLHDTWKKLEAGDYDWAHLAHTLWPERVIPKCATDRSLAIAHGYEDDLWEEVEDKKGKLTWQPKKDTDEIVQQLIENL